MHNQVISAPHTQVPCVQIIWVFRTRQQLQSVGYWEQSQNVILEEKMS